jgi:hypothetical protein
MKEKYFASMLLKLTTKINNTCPTNIKLLIFFSGSLLLMYKNLDSLKKEMMPYIQESMQRKGKGAASLLYHRASAAPSLLQVTVYQVECSMLAQVLCMLDPKMSQFHVFQWPWQLHSGYGKNTNE